MNCMKRITAALCMSTVLMAANGCAMQQTPGNVSNRMGGAFSAELTMTTADNEVKGELTRYGMEAWSVTFTEPPALAGVQLDFIDDEVTASYKGLEFSVPQSAQAVKTMLAEMMDIMDDMAEEPELHGRQEDDRIVFEGEIDEGGYTLTFDKEGVPLEFSLPPYGLTIVFDSFTENGSAAGTQQTTETKPAETQTTETQTASETST